MRMKKAYHPYTKTNSGAVAPLFVFTYCAGNVFKSSTRAMASSKLSMS